MLNRNGRAMLAETTEVTDSLRHRFPSSPGAVRWFAALLCLVVIIAASDKAFAQSRAVLGPGDSIRVTVFQSPDLTTEARISERGAQLLALVSRARARAREGSPASSSAAMLAACPMQMVVTSFFTYCMVS